MLGQRNGTGKGGTHYPGSHREVGRTPVNKVRRLEGLRRIVVPGQKSLTTVRAPTRDR